MVRPGRVSQEDKRDVLHAVYRVGDMATTIEYYKKHFGAKLLRYRDIPEVWLLSPTPRYWGRC